ncbi:RNA polymerase sigma factor, sigma-70 family [Catalinimonas alkaloidigena]|uniref:RNA polymerase sigma factor, sigma-70 family n=1 Tax=Catalinimonas alkaloidigena TaxID=1075417 RepID=A0A1G9QGK2_9BACT|nr:sigma-70 family RNA polymerase sigma factor [Catalinimonas alkaloidigena]SDM10224.1 RNA polymerase sigma factor, sigma-70 family [Catalinimonas alkaloidigena]
MQVLPAADCTSPPQGTARPNDERLWAQMQQGHADALDALYRRYVQLLYNYGRKLVADGTVVEDAIQDLFVELWRRRQDLSATTSVKFYLLKAFKQKLLRRMDHDRRMLARHARADFYDFEVAHSHEFQLITDQISREEKERLTRALAALTPRQKEAIFLKYYEKLSFQEVAELLNLSVKATYKLMGRAIGTLREHMQHVSIFVIAGWLAL